MASTNDSYHTDSTTGLKVHILTGQGDFTKWMRDLKLAAESKDVWVLINPESVAEADRETIHPKPTRPTKPVATAVPRGSTQEVAEGLQEQFKMANNMYSNDVTDYKLDVSEYDEQQKRLRTARSLLLSTITPAIRDSVSDKIIASEVLTSIKALCKMTDGQAQQYCYQKLDNVKYSDFSSVSDCINTITTY
jgi:hypothetical protein